MTVLETHYGIDIVSTKNTLGGSPRIEDTRIGVYHLLPEAENTDVEAALTKYPHLSRPQVQAAFRFYEENQEYLALEKRRHEDLERWANARNIKCKCGITFPNPKELTAHIKQDGRYPVPDEDATHSAGEHVFEGTITCTCDATFETHSDFLEHYDNKAWPPDPEHFIAYVTAE